MSEVNAYILFSDRKAKEIGDKIGVDWNKIDLEQFRMGLGVELEHGRQKKYGGSEKTNVTDDNLISTGKIALAHIYELPDYYTRLKRMEMAKSCLLMLSSI